MNIIFDTQFGSHIYGTSTPASDLDYKGIYMAEWRDIVLKRDKESIVTCTKKDKRDGVRNQAGDIDREYKELRRFISDAISGQTYALDMLYTPQEFWIKTSPMWEELWGQRSKFLSKSMNAFLGYIRQQCGKYAMKGTRMAAVVSTVEFLQTVNPKLMLKDVWDMIPKNDFVKLEEYESLVNGQPRKEIMLSVLEKKFQEKAHVKFILEILSKFYNEFGGRSKMAMSNQGVDWKAISHAYRACYQLLDIAREGKIIFPLTQAKKVLEIKSGQISYKDVIQEELPLLMEDAMEAIEKSSLPDQVEKDCWDEFILKHYER